jgi:hypothetical protein
MNEGMAAPNAARDAPLPVARARRGHSSKSKRTKLTRRRARVSNSFESTPPDERVVDRNPRQYSRRRRCIDYKFAATTPLESRRCL